MTDTKRGPICGATLGDGYIDTGTLARRRAKPPGVIGRAGLQGTFHSAPAIAVKDFIGSGPDLQVGPGLSAMLVTELGSLERASRPRLIEWERRAEILREIEFSNSKWADPHTRIPRGHLIAPDLFIEGKVTSTGNDEISWQIQIVDARTHEVIGVETGSTRSPDFLDAPGGIAKRLNELLWAWWKRKQIKLPLRRPHYRKHKQGKPLPLDKPVLRRPLVS